LLLIFLYHAADKNHTVSTQWTRSALSPVNVER